MPMADLNGPGLHWREDGNPAGRPVVFSNALGTDMRIWDAVVARMPPELRIIRYDTRGHGLSDCPPRPYAMGALVSDAERLLEHMGISACAFVGLSIGGMIAQGLAVKRPDLVRAVVLSNTATKIGTAASWDERIAAVEGGGIEALADGTMERWFSRRYLETAESRLWRNMLVRTPVDGYLGCMAAIRGTDLMTPTSGLNMPALAIAGSEDGSTPPDLVRETAELIAGAEFRLIRGAGHVPCIEAPEDYAQALTDFLGAAGFL